MARLFLDFDGTLVDSSERQYRVFRDACAELGIAVSLTRDAYWMLKRNSTPDVSILPQYHPGAVVPEQYRLKHARMIEDPAYLAYDVPFPGVAAALARLAGAYQLVVVTARGNPETFRAQLDRLPFRQYISSALVASDRSIPFAECKCAVVRQHFPGQLDARAFIGDTEVDIEAGRLLGCETIAVTYGIRSRERLAAANPVHVVDSLEDVCQLLSV
jgi:phosphoglycolate phosphatase-like HAD superfamily hydrolase